MYKIPSVFIALSKDFSKVKLPEDIVMFPEAGKSPEQIEQFVKSLDGASGKFATYSLYLLREVALQGIKVMYVNYLEDGTTSCSDDVDAIGPIAILDAELEQSDRYLKWVDTVSDVTLN